MKRTKIYALLAAVTVLGFTSCIDETSPESSTVTAEQLSASSSALAAAVSGIPSQMTEYYLVYEGEQVHETDMAYPQFMIAQTEMLGDMYPGNADNVGYDWFQNYNTFSRSYGDDSYFAYLPWFTLYQFVKSANNVIGSIDITDETLTDEVKGYAGVAYACRAFDYYMLTVLFEPVDNIYTDCSSVLGLTVPIVTDTTTVDNSKNNPRVSHDDMIAFILSDLDKAEEYLSNYTPSVNTLPDLSVVYGLKAKVYLWDEDYANAAKYARMAIDESGATPMSESEWTDPTTAFAQACDSWMWYVSYSAENMSNLCNLTGWLSSEADWGYSSLTQPCIDRSLYDEISSSDFRKHVFLDPDKYDYYNYQTCRDAEFIEDAPDYMSLKFRCLSGDYENYATGGAIDVPVMRVEEMYFIEALATATATDVASGVELLNTFMKTYRDPSYNCTLSDLTAFQKEVLTQMRIEFWGEGNAFPVAKMLKPGVMQNYEGTNAPSDIFKRNCAGIKPNWNLVIPRSEIESNTAIEGYNNPDPTACIDYPSPIGEYSPGNY
ncbi:MAG: RagB/SusD family nutrient uptake outer membrane protein [Prevotellaceae bacterium]|nr:RagB/SusD family nutrient uptake outer membrane protein [Prevotellaceae bacterium]